MILSLAARVTLAVAGVLAAGGVATLARLRTLPPAAPAAYAARIAGTMLVMLGLALTLFTLVLAASVPLP